jgi:hypothetical protein
LLFPLQLWPFHHLRLISARVARRLVDARLHKRSFIAIERFGRVVAALALYFSMSTRAED